MAPEAPMSDRNRPLVNYGFRLTGLRSLQIRPNQYLGTRSTVLGKRAFVGADERPLEDPTVLFVISQTF